MTLPISELSQIMEIGQECPFCAWVDEPDPGIVVIKKSNIGNIVVCNKYPQIHQRLTFATKVEIENNKKERE